MSDLLPPAADPVPPRRPPKKFRGFPKANGYYHIERIRTDFLEAPEPDWLSYCAARTHNPDVKGLPWRAWVREKKYREAFRGVLADVEREGISLGPQLLLRQLRAVRSVPETAAAMLSLVQHSIRVHLDEAKADEIHLKQYRELGVPLPTLRFTLDPAGCAMLASALKTTSELLHKSLGIDTSQGMTPERWKQLVDAEVGKMDGTQEIQVLTVKNPVKVEIMGAANLQESMKEAFEKWMDKPGTETPLEIVAAPPPPPEGEVIEHDADQ